MSRKTKLEDALGECSSFAAAIHLAAAGLPNTRDMCAFQVIADQIVSRLEDARCIIDEMGDDADD